MSRSPLQEGEAGGAARDRYLEGWADLNERLRRGEPWSGGERNAAFLSSGVGGLDLADAAPVLGLDHADDGRSAARLDVDFDGDDDLVVSSRTAPRLRVLANRLADGAEHLSVRLVGTEANRDAVGAVVFAAAAADVEGDGEGAAARPQRRTRTAGSGYLAQSTPWLRFGFGRRGARARRVRLSVRWPGELEPEDFGEVRAGRRYVLVQGRGSASESPPPEALVLREGPIEPRVPEQGGRRRLVLPSPTSIPSLDVRSASGRGGRIFGLTPAGPRGTGRNTVVVAWDSSDPGAIEGLGDLGALSSAAETAGAMLVAVDLAAGSAGPREPDPLVFATTRLAAAGWGGDVLAPQGEAATVLAELVGWRLDRTEAPPLPWSLVMEPDGRLAVVRTGPWRAGDLEADLEVFGAPLDQRPAWSTTFPGRWADPPGEADLGRLRARLERRGAGQAVRELDLGQIKTPSLGSADVRVRRGRAALERGDLAEALARFEAAIEADGDHVMARRARAFVLHRVGRYGEALEEWGRALDLDPASNDTLGNRALAAVAAGELGVARADLAELTRRVGAAAPVVLAVRGALEQAAGPEGSRDPGDPGGAADPRGSGDGER